MGEPAPDSGLSVGDHAEIERVLASYAISLDVDDIDTALALFTEGGEFDVYDRVFTGQAKLRRMFESAPRGLHLAGRSVIEPSAGGALARLQLVFYPADDAPRRLAVYDVALVKPAERWLIGRMTCRFMNADGALTSRP